MCRKASASASGATEGDTGGRRNRRTAAPYGRRASTTRRTRVGYAALVNGPRTLLSPALPGPPRVNLLRLRVLPLALLLALASASPAAAQERVYTHADTLRGSITPERAWWDVVFYDLHVRLDPADSTIRGWNGISYRVIGASRAMCASKGRLSTLFA